MKIGWVRYSGGISLLPGEIGPGGAVEIRLGLMNMLLEHGHHLNIFGVPTAKTSKNFSESPLARYRGNIMFSPDTDKPIGDSVELLIVENGPTNTEYSGNYNGKTISHIAATNKFISSYNGLVFFWQTDPYLPFVFFPEFYARSFVNEYMGFGSFGAMLKDKAWVIVNPFRKTLEDPDILLNHYGEDMRSGYHIVRPWVKCCECQVPALKILMEQAQGLNFSYPKKYAVSYVGRQRNRLKNFVALYARLSEFGKRVSLFGEWDERLKSLCGFMDFNPPAPRGMRSVLEIYANSTAHIVVGDDAYYKLGMIGSRFLDATASGTVPLVDEGLKHSVIHFFNSSPEVADSIFVNPDNVADRVAMLESDPSMHKALSEYVQSNVVGYLDKSYEEFMEIRDWAKFGPTMNPSQVFIRLLDSLEKLAAEDPKKSEQVDEMLMFLSNNYDSEGCFVGRKYELPVKERVCSKCGKSLTGLRKTCESCRAVRTPVLTE